jgi:hypothetical protein
VNNSWSLKTMDEAQIEAALAAGALMHLKK